MKRSCETCEFWDSPAHGDADLGVCHGGPPSPDEAGYAIWPITDNVMWCGSYRIAERLIPSIGRLGAEDAVRLMRRPSDTLSTPETETANGPTRT